MALKEDLEAEVERIFSTVWSSKTMTSVPVETDVTFGNVGVWIEATILYADLSNSTGLVDTQRAEFAAEIYKTFLRCASRIIKAQGGVLTAFDGDRVMAVFMGEGKENSACWAAFRINAAMQDIIWPKLKPYSSYIPRHTVGIDSSTVFVVKDGVRADNDLIWIGRAANYAAKMCAMDDAWPTRITVPVYAALEPTLLTDNAGNRVWEAEGWAEMNNLVICRSGHKATQI